MKSKARKMLAKIAEMMHVGNTLNTDLAALKRLNSKHQPSPRGGWPITPRSRSKYAPHYGANAAARNLKHMQQATPSV